MSIISEFDHLDGEDRVKAENEFTKMKLMLEKGAEFHRTSDQEVDPYVEKEMLNCIVEFERQVENPKFIRIFDKLHKPVHFKPVDQIPDETIEQAWQKLSAYMDRFDINLDVCSPNISFRELYRFATEELFQIQINDIHIPGMKCMFIYDEFYPDPVYDNSRTAIDDCIRYILNKNPMEGMHNFRNDGLVLNEHTGISNDQFKIRVNQYKLAYDDMDIREIKVSQCQIDEDRCTVTGNYLIIFYLGNEALDRKGNWQVDLELDKEKEYWKITRVKIDGIAF